MGSAPPQSTSKSTQTDGKYHVSPSMTFAFTAITTAL